MRPSLTLFLFPLLAAARLHHSLVPEDPYVFPKYRVTFLNGLPVLNETADRWLRDGLQGGELEFLDQPWRDSTTPAPQLKSIEGSQPRDANFASAPAPSHASDYALEHMKIGSRMSYVCLIPPPPEDTATADEPSTDVTPVDSWSLLQPLMGTCLYHKQGWFTYSYCHNLHVRQFHELLPQQPLRPGEYKPEEDTEWESYTLGRAPPSLEAGADLTVAEEAARVANLELARGAGSRYLVQRWGDGTYCDKTGRKREIEVQFHCSMTMTDTILFVKETQTCHYVLHIATPRLCGVPGFKSRVDSREETYIRCREVLGVQEYEHADRSLPAADQPLKKIRREKPVIAPPPIEESVADTKVSPKKHGDLLRQALERFMSRNDVGDLADTEIVVEEFDDGGDGEVIIQFIAADVEVDGDEEGSETVTFGGESLAEVLRTAGYNIKGEKIRQKSTGEKSDSKKEEGQSKRKTEKGRGREAGEAKTQRRDEL